PYVFEATAARPPAPSNGSITFCRCTHITLSEDVSSSLSTRFCTTGKGARSETTSNHSAHHNQESHPLLFSTAPESCHHGLCRVCALWLEGPAVACKGVVQTQPIV
ncbi:hypothetical protein A6R68_19349, partial [Neotoma lepida]